MPSFGDALPGAILCLLLTGVAVALVVGIASGVRQLCVELRGPRAADGDADAVHGAVPVAYDWHGVAHPVSIAQRVGPGRSGRHSRS